MFVPAGYQVSLGEVVMTGSNVLPRGARSQINFETFFAGMRGPLLQRNFTGPLVGEFRTSNVLNADSAVWSGCGAQVILRINLNAWVMSNSRRENAEMTVNPNLLSKPIDLRVRRCAEE